MVHTQRFLKKPIKILYEDSFYVIFDKPAGVVVIPTPKESEKTLVNIVNHQYAGKDNAGRLHPCHRLDRDTSGAIIFARGKKNQQRVMDEFRKSQVKKEYIAFVQGVPRKQGGEIKSAITHLDRRNQKVKPKLAITHYEVVRTYKEFSIVKINLVTGRTNQIRIHFKDIGHPLVGERKYAFPRDYSVKFKRTALHAHKILFNHPVFKRIVRAESPMPKDMKEFLEKY